MNHVLGGFRFPYNPPRRGFSGINSSKKRADFPTLEGNLTFNWGIEIAGTPVALVWQFMDDDFYQELLKLYETGLEYPYNIGDGHIYIVEIEKLSASFYKEYAGKKYWRNIRLELMITGEKEGV